MNKYIYKVSRTDDYDCDNYDSFVVCCYTKQEAITFHPYFNNPKIFTLEMNVVYDFSRLRWIYKDSDVNCGYKYSKWIKGKDIYNLKVENIGLAHDTVEIGIILSSYNAC